MTMQGWIGVDLDGTLAHYDGWKGDDHIGEPIPLMAQRVRDMLSTGIVVKIVTARTANGPAAIDFIKAWCKLYFGQELEVTDKKDFGMIVLFDDRAVAVEENTGVILGGRRNW